MSIAEAEGRVTSYSYASLKRKSTRPSLISSLSCRAIGVLAVSFCRLRNVKFVLFSSSSIYRPFSTKMRACMRETPPSSPPCGVRSTSGKMLLTASSRPIITLSLPLRSHSWLSASTIRRAVRAGMVATGAATGVGAAAGVGVASGVAAAGADAPLSILPQVAQKASPAGLTVPHEGQTWLPASAVVAGGGGGGGGGGADRPAGGPRPPPEEEPPPRA